MLSLRVELKTSRLLNGCSNQLSYESSFDLITGPVNFPFNRRVLICQKTRREVTNEFGCRNRWEQLTSNQGPTLSNDSERKSIHCQCHRLITSEQCITKLAKNPNAERLI